MILLIPAISVWYKEYCIKKEYSHCPPIIDINSDPIFFLNILCGGMIAFYSLYTMIRYAVELQLIKYRRKFNKNDIVYIYSFSKMRVKKCKIESYYIYNNKLCYMVRYTSSHSVNCMEELISNRYFRAFSADDYIEKLKTINNRTNYIKEILL